VGRAETLLSYNRLFGVQDCRLPVQSNDFAAFASILDGLDQAAIQDRQPALALGAAALVDKLRNAVDKPRALRMLGAVSRTGGQMGLVSGDTVAVLERIFANYPPGRFAGFTAWGPGNHGTPGSNKLEHFAKHVLHDYGEGETAPPKDEQVMWWWGLNLNIRLDVVCSPLVIHPKLLDLFHDNLVALCGVGPSNPGFAAAAAAVRIDHSQPEGLELLTTMSQRVPTVGSKLFDLIGGRYVDFAVNGSKNMRDVQVHLSQSDYFISGVFQNVYVIGRIIDGVAGISAAYWAKDPADKTGPATQQRLWLIKD
jgi:hypothetical protein